MKYYWCIVAFILFFAGCNKDEELEPSYQDKDWFSITDDPADPVQHKVYEVFNQWGIPVFFNDTLGYQERGTDKSGNPVIFYKLIDLNFMLNQPSGTVSTKEFTLIGNHEDRKTGIDWLEEFVLPLLPETFYIHSILLVDELYEVIYNPAAINSYWGFNAVAIGNIPALTGKSQAEKRDYANTVLTELIISYLSGHTTEKIADFYRVSYDPVKQQYFYKMTVCTPLYPGYNCLEPDVWEVYGFLDCDRTRTVNISSENKADWWYYMVAEAEDVKHYVKAILNYTQDEFTSLYEAYPRVLQKYSIMCEILSELGVEIK